MVNKKAIVYVVFDYGDVEFITTNKNTACYYWWENRRKVYGKRPDIVMFQLGCRDGGIRLGDQEIQDYINEREALKNALDKRKDIDGSVSSRNVIIDETGRIRYQTQTESSKPDSERNAQAFQIDNQTKETPK